MPNDPDINENVLVDHYLTENAMVIEISTGKTAWEILNFYVKNG